MRTTLSALILGSLLAAGCVDAPEDLGAASAQAPSDALAPLGTSTAFTYDGTIGAAVIACPMITCAGLNDPASDRVTPIDIKGELTAVAITLTWDATAPNMETLRTGIAWGPSDAREYEMLEGTSPLVLDVDGLSLTSSDDVTYWVWVPTPVPMGLVIAAAPQDFHAEGTLTMTEASQ